MSLVCGRLNNRKARIARLERDKQQRQGTEGDVLNASRPEKSRRSVASDDMDSPAEASPRRNEDVDMDHEEVEPLKFAQQASRTPSNANAAACSEGNEQGNSGTSTVINKWKIGDTVSLRGNDDAEMAVGTITQVEGSWQRCNLEDEKLCVVEVSELKVEKTTKLPFPGSVTGACKSFEEAETLGGVSRVPWDIDHIVLYSSLATIPSPPLLKAAAAVNSIS